MNSIYKISLIAIALLAYKISFGQIQQIRIEDDKVIQLNLGMSDDTNSLEIIIPELNQLKNHFLVIPKHNIDYVGASINSGKYYVSGQNIKTKIEYVEDPYYIYPIQSNDSVLLQVKSNEQLILPIDIINEVELENKKFIRNTLSSLFIGILVALLLYNFVLFFFLKDYNYLFYILYLLFIGIAQLDILGYTYYFLKGFPDFHNIAMHICSGISGIFGVLFIQKFLRTKTNIPIGHGLLNVIITLYFVVLVLTFIGFDIIAYQFIQLAGVSLPTILGIAIILGTRGHKEGIYVAMSYLVLFIGIIFYLFKDFEILPFNMLTNYTLSLGVALQAILLSVALASRINLLNQEKNEANERVFQEVKKNEELVRTQNVILEDKVKQRTAELEQALEDLKSTQSQLVQSEKMASLGVLTAGIAHEINNPINFVTANIIPLRENIESITNLLNAYKAIDLSNPDKSLETIEKMEQDIELDYIKEETSQLINGIEEGAKRTHSIVDGLKTFSHGDSDLTMVSDINKGINSTLSVLKSKLKGVSVVKNLESDMPKIKCQIGKLNQVFLNLINNALDALEEKYGSDTSQAELKISSSIVDNNVIVTVEDNANGIPEDVQKKIFEPFFTTKEVGKGTGLGMSISYSIVEEHEGDLTFESKVGEGTKFKITLPLG